MTILEARILRIEQTLGLAAVEMNSSAAYSIREAHQCSIQEAIKILRQTNIEKEFEYNIKNAEFEEQNRRFG